MSFAGGGSNQYDPNSSSPSSSSSSSSSSSTPSSGIAGMFGTVQIMGRQIPGWILAAALFAFMMGGLRGLVGLGVLIFIYQKNQEQQQQQGSSSSSPSDSSDSQPKGNVLGGT
eukprot:TRINITY_DN2078_c0_g2_i5.p1 TRINITY_DN2078_c0_g2~~TRINITY_DN2078_c0_g2_i5.p1  ORF type:complete len:113 (-),score=36.58 TRINITY_DN2078_c0_g2_i5:161-499(-)